MSIYSIRDNKASAFNTPFFSESDVLATRSLTQAVRDPRLQLSMFPEDFDLYRLGLYDPVSGIISPAKQPEFVVSAVAVFSPIVKKGDSDVSSNS